MSVNCGIEIQYDEVLRDYYIVWKLPVAIGSGSTEIEALHDVRDAAQSCIDTLINQKLKEVSKED